MPAGKGEELRRAWPALLACIVGIGVGISSITFYSAGLFFKSLESDFGWTRAQVASGSLATTLGIAIAAPFVGKLADRFGSWVIALLSMLAVAVGFLMLSLQSGHFAVYLLILVSMALLGAGSSPVTFTRVINGWFDSARGLALGIALAGTGVAGTLIPLLLGPYVAERGWRAGYLALAIAVVAAIPLVAVLLKEPPGGSVALANDSPQGGTSFTLVVRSREFRLMLVAFFAMVLPVAGLAVHLVPMLQDAGLSGSGAARIASLLGVAVIIGRLVVGVLVDRLFAPIIGAATCILCAGGCLALLFGGPAWAPATAFMLGFATGAEVDLVAYMAARYFGLRAYGRVYGWLYGSVLLGAGFAPMAVGKLQAVWSGYRPVLWLAALVLGVTAIVLLRLRRFPARMAVESA